MSRGLAVRSRTRHPYNTNPARDFISSRVRLNNKLAEREGFEPSIEVTPYAGLASRPGKPTTSKRVMGCTKQKTPLSCELTVSHDKPVINPSTDNPPALSPDLAGIVAAWSSIPDQIKAAVKAVLAPYLTHEAEKEGGK